MPVICPQGPTNPANPAPVTAGNKNAGPAEQPKAAGPAPSKDKQSSASAAPPAAATDAQKGAQKDAKASGNKAKDSGASKGSAGSATPAGTAQAGGEDDVSIDNLDIRCLGLMGGTGRGCRPVVHASQVPVHGRGVPEQAAGCCI